MGRPHLLVIPFPAQGHVMPLMELSHNLVDRGFKITFVNTEFNHKRIVEAMSNNNGEHEEFIHLVSIPDGMEEGEDRKQRTNLLERVYTVMPGHLENLIRKMNESDNGDDRITCVIADENVSWALEVAQKMSIPKVGFWSASSALRALTFHIPKLIEDEIIAEDDGSLIKNQTIHLSPTMPAMNPAHLPWLCLGDLSLQKSLFNLMARVSRAVKVVDYIILCNSFSELESSALSLVPNLRPIGPLSASSRLAHFWPEDSTCLSWLDQQPAHSVVYVAFGSSTIMDKRQFNELALGLELSNKTFLWVVRPNLMNEDEVYPDGFEARVGSRGRMVAWAPQREVLAHPSIGGFFTHCGWNSTMEALSQGVPLLCWPYFADQILNKSYICDVWKNGLGLKPDAGGMISREEIKTQMVRLLDEKGIKQSAQKLKETALGNVASLKNFDDFILELNELSM